MSQTTEELLIDHLDSSLLGKGLPNMEQLIRNDRAVAAEWKYLHLAVGAIQEAALYEQVGSIKRQWLSQPSVAIRPTGAVVRTMYRNVMRVAACILVLAGGSAVYKYTTTNSAGLYKEYYSSYDLNNMRGAGAADPMEQAYNNKNWEEVINLFNSSKEKSNQSYFLTGMANLELKNYPDAIEKFNQVLAENTRSGSDYYQDETEYYLAMSFLANNEAAKAMPLLEKIKADKDHLYHQIVAKMSSLDLKIIDYKTRK